MSETKQSNTIRSFRATLCAALLSAVILVLTALFDLDLFERLVVLFASLERYEVDEFFLVAVILAMGDGRKAAGAMDDYLKSK